jgi:Tellurite resistance protein TerB
MTQKQREAVVDLLLLGMFADAPLRVSEDQKLLSVIEEIGWDSYQTPDLYLQSAIARARDASDTEAGTTHRLEKIAEKLHDPELRRQALQYLTQFLGVDGAVDAEESKFLELTKAALNVRS